MPAEKSLFFLLSFCVSWGHAILRFNESYRGTPHFGEVPFPWGEVFHFPFFQYQTGLLADEWVPMNYEEMFRYYNVHETCVALGFHPEHCKAKYPFNDLKRCHLYNVGGVWPEDFHCPNMKGNFIRHVSTKPWPESAHIVDVIGKLKQHGANMLYFIGDSLTGQHFSDAHCSLLRFGVTFSQTDRFHLILDDPNDPLSHREILPNEDLSKRYFNMHFNRFDSYGETPFERLEKDINSTIKNFTSPVVFIVNIGLHYNTRNQVYLQDLKAFFNYWTRMVKQHNHIVIYRETTAQHFHTANGLYSWNIDSDDYQFQLHEDMLVDNAILFSSMMHPKNRKRHKDVQRKEVEKPKVKFCRPIRTEKELAENNWRNVDMYKVLNELDPRKEFVQVAEFHRVSAGRHDLHTLGEDCAHFCASPVLWLPLWQRIYDIVDNQLKKKHSSSSVFERIGDDNIDVAKKEKLKLHKYAASHPHLEASEAAHHYSQKIRNQPN